MEEDPKDFSQRSQEFSEKLKILCEEYGIDLAVSLQFPQFNILPPEIELCNLILTKNEGQFVIYNKDRLEGGNNANATGHGSRTRH